MTPEQIKEVAAKTGISEEVLTAFEKGEKKADEVFDNVLVFKKEDFDARIKNEIEKAKPEIERTAIGNTYGAIDRRISELSGLKPGEGEKTADFISRVIAEKSNLKGNEEVERLRKEVAAKDNLLSEKEKAFTEMKTQFETKEKTLTIHSRLDSVINSLPIDAEKPEDAERQRRLLKLALLDEYQVDSENGILKFVHKQTGKEMRDDKRAELMSEKEIISSFAPSIVKLKSGEPSKQGPGYKPAPLDPANVQFSQFKNIGEFVEHAQKSGIKTHGPEWQTLEQQAVEHFGQQKYAAAK